jgi:hypothetical protein
VLHEFCVVAAIGTLPLPAPWVLWLLECPGAGGSCREVQGGGCLPRSGSTAVVRIGSLLWYWPREGDAHGVVLVWWAYWCAVLEAGRTTEAASQPAC